MSAVAETRPSVFATGSNVSLGRLVRSEWIKVTTIRSTWWSIGITLVLSLTISLLMAMSMSSYGAAGTQSAIQVALAPMFFTVLLAAVLGVIQVTGEYSTGMIRSTMTAGPDRVRAVLSKFIVVGAVIFLSNAVIMLISAALGAGIMSVAIDGEVLLKVVYGAFVVSVIGLLGVAAGFLIRGGGGAIAAIVGLVYVISMVSMFLGMIPSMKWVSDAAQYLPTGLGEALTGIPFAFVGGPDASDGVLVLLLFAWVAVGLIASIVIVKKRDV